MSTSETNKISIIIDVESDERSEVQGISVYLRRDPSDLNTLLIANQDELINELPIRQAVATMLHSALKLVQANDEEWTEKTESKRSK